MLEQISNALKFLQTTLIYLVYPPICPVCQQIVDERYQLCEDCAKNILQVEETKDFPPPISGVIRITKYRGGSRSMLRKLKFDSCEN